MKYDKDFRSVRGAMLLSIVCNVIVAGYGIRDSSWIIVIASMVWIGCGLLYVCWVFPVMQRTRDEIRRERAERPSMGIRS